MSFRTKDQDANNPEYMTLEMLARRVQLLAEYSLIDYQNQLMASDATLDVEQMVEDVVDAVRQRERQSRSYRFGRSNKANLDRPSRAFLTNVITHKKLEPYKRILIGRYRRELDHETLTIWFIQRLLNQALDHHWHYVAMAMLKILFLYEHQRFTAVTSMLELFETRHRHPSEDQLRRWKKKTIDDLEIWFGDLVETTREKVGSHPEKHFRRPPTPQANLDLTVECLRIEALPREPCVLTPENELESRTDVRCLLEKLTASESADVVERILMHLLTCPEALFPTLNALQVNDFGEKLGIPLFFVSSGQNTFQLERREVVKGFQPHKIDIKKKLQDRDNRRRRLTLNKIFIVVDNVIRQVVFCDEPKTFMLNLEYGERILEVRAEDDEGYLPLDLHYVPWTPDLEDRPYIFLTTLKGRHELKFMVTYARDETGDLSKATVEVCYSPDKGKRWMMAACVVGLLALLTAAKSFNANELPFSVSRVALGFLAVGLPALLFMSRNHNTRSGVLALVLSVLAILFALPVRWSSLPDSSTVDKAMILDNSSNPRLVQKIGNDHPTKPKHKALVEIEGPPAISEKESTDLPHLKVGKAWTVNRKGGRTKDQLQFVGHLTTTYSQSAIKDQEEDVEAWRLEQATNSGTNNRANITRQKIDRTAVFSTSAQSDKPGLWTVDRQAVVAGDSPMPGTSKRNAVIKSDQIIQVDLIDPINSESSHDGDLFRTTVVRAIYENGVPVVPKGTIAIGRIAKVSNAVQGTVKDTLDVHLVMLELVNQTVRINGELLFQCPDQTSVTRTSSIFAPRSRPRVAFVGDSKKGAVIAPAPVRRTIGQPERGVALSYVSDFPYSSTVTRAVLEPGKEPAIGVCFALKKSVSISPFPK